MHTRSRLFLALLRRSGRYGLAASGLLLAGCVSAQPSAPAATSAAQEQARVKERLAQIFRAAEAKDLPRLDGFHWYGPHFTKFASTGPRMAAAAAREGEHKGVSGATELKLDAEDLKIDLFGTTAVATFVATIQFKSGADTVRKRERATLVFARHDGSWQIVHEHFSAAE